MPSRSQEGKQSLNKLRGTLLFTNLTAFAEEGWVAARIGLPRRRENPTLSVPGGAGLVRGELYFNSHANQGTVANSFF